MAQTKPDAGGWDRRAWTVGLISSNLCGMAHAVSAILDKTSHSNGATSHHDSGYVLAEITTLMAVFVLPAVMALIARRRFLIWGLLPLFTVALWAIPAHYLLGQFAQIHQDLTLIPAYVLLSVVLVSGPISLVRQVHVRRQQKRQAAIDAYTAQREAASIPQEGVWPPPPDYRESGPCHEWHG